MDGITILNQVEIMEPPVWVCVVGLLSIILLVVTFAIMLAARNEVVGIVSAIIALLSLASAILFCGILDLEEPTGRYKYEVLIEDESIFKDIYDTYEIVEQRGDIWVLEDKEVD